MNGEKVWYESRGMVGSLVAMLSGLASLAGYVISSEDQDILVGLILAGGSLIGGALSWWGRLRANKRVTLAGPVRGDLAGLLIFLIILPFLVACPDNIRPQTTEERIEAMELTARQAQVRIVNLTCTKFDAGQCIEPGKPLNPDQAIELHDQVASARAGLSAASAMLGIGSGQCLGQVRTIDGCLIEINTVLLTVTTKLPTN